MHFQDLRHTHKTWLIEDDIPEIAQAKRLGHRMPGVRGIYSRVTPAMQQRITEALQDRWFGHSAAAERRTPAPARRVSTTCTTAARLPACRAGCGASSLLVS
jgi:hypothetical protein